jgi:hypothetical protein
MNKIVREHYPVSRLPSDLREGMDPHTQVTVIVSEEGMSERSSFSFREVFDALHADRVLSDDPVMRIRALREEWDERRRFLDRIPRGGSE